MCTDETTYRDVVFDFTVEAGEVHPNRHQRTHVRAVRHGPKHQDISSSAAAINGLRSDDEAAKMLSIDGYILFINFKFIFLQSIDRKHCVTMEISMPHSDVFSNLRNISQDMGYL